LALDVYFRDDILNVLRATYAAADGPAALLGELVRDPELRQLPLDRLVEVYRQGFCTALGAVALAFGLDPAERHSNSGGGFPTPADWPEPQISVASPGRTLASNPQSGRLAFLK
jgi:hypothetical protein